MHTMSDLSYHLCDQRHTKFLTRTVLTPCTGLLIIAATALTPVAAQDDGPPRGFGLGIGVVVRQEAIRDLDTDAFPIPIAFYEGERFFIRGPRVGLRMIRDERLQVSLVARPEFGGYDADDSDFLDGMDDRGATLELGGTVRVPTRFVDWSVDAFVDVLGEHEGFEASAGVSRAFPLGRTIITPEFAVSYLSENKADFYYGVRPDEARPNRPAFSVDAEFSYEAGLGVRRLLTRKWTLFGNASARLLGGNITDSPIVDEDFDWSLIGGVTYRF